MLLLLVFATAAALAAADPIPVPDEQQDGRIVGGKLVPIEHFPYQVAINYRRGFFCGGSIISKNYVLTAAHCASDSESNMKKLYQIRAGTNASTVGGSVHRITDVVTYRFWGKSEDILGDAAIIRVDPPFIYDSTRQPIKLATESFKVRAGALATVSGFGQLGSAAPLSKKLRAVSVPIVNWRKCQELYETFGSIVTQDSICAGYDHGRKDSCQGDSGGPLVYKGKQIGIVSWGYGCAEPGVPGVYQSVAAIRKFIRTVAKV